MKKPDYIPQDYDRIEVVESLSDVFKTALDNNHDAVMTPRRLQGDFNRLVDLLLENKQDILVSYTRQQFAEATLYTHSDDQLDTAIGHIMRDMIDMESQGYKPRLRVLRNYDPASPVTYFHNDPSPGYDHAERVLCCYTGPVTEWVRAQDVQKVEYNGVCVTREDAQVFEFKNGDVWKQGFWNERKPHPCFAHRAPSNPQKAPRLLLVGTKR